MGVFQSKPEPRPVSKSNSSENASNGGETLIAAGVVFTGDLEGAGNVTLEGKIIGNVHCKRLRIGPSGTLEGKAVVESLVVDGAIEGSISAKSVLFGKNAQVSGDVHHEVLEVEAGARVEGRYVREKANIGADLKEKKERAVPTNGSGMIAAAPAAPSKDL